MLSPYFVILAAGVSLLGSVFYARDTLHGRTHPNRVTWLLWGLIPMVAFAVEIQSGVGLQSLMTFAVGFGPLIVLAASAFNRSSVWQVSRLDYACGALSLAGILVWVVTERGAVALAASIAADFLAGLPTIVKSWRAPETETAAAYWGSLVSATITLLTVTTWTLTEVAFPLFIAVGSTLMVTLVAGRVGTRWRAWRTAGGPQAAAEAGAPSTGASVAHNAR